MTNKEALIASILVTVSEAAIDKGLIDTGITGSDNYVAANERNIDLAAIKVLTTMIALADVSEGDFFVKYNYKAIQARLELLNNKYFPVLAPEPTVNGFNGW